MPEFQTHERLLWDKIKFTTVVRGRRRWGESHVFATPLKGPANPRFHKSEAKIKQWFWQVLDDAQRKEIRRDAGAKFMRLVNHRLLAKRESSITLSKSMKYCYMNDSYVARAFMKERTCDHYSEIEDGKVISVGVEPGSYEWTHYDGVDWATAKLLDWLYAVSYVPALWEKAFPRVYARQVAKAYECSQAFTNA